jgi:hypothetical protein
MVPSITFIVYGYVFCSYLFSDTLVYRSPSECRTFIMDETGLMIAIMGIPLGGIAFLFYPFHGLVFWIVLITLAFFSTDISQWLLRRRMTNLGESKEGAGREAHEDS